jgi:hypothetical protein
MIRGKRCGGKGEARMCENVSRSTAAGVTGRGMRSITEIAATKFKFLYLNRASGYLLRQIRQEAVTSLEMPPFLRDPSQATRRLPRQVGQINIIRRRFVLTRKETNNGQTNLAERG